MPITELQREQRTRHLGSSDAPAVLGVDPWRSPVDVWLEKTGRLEPVEFKNEAAEIGTMIEDSLLDWCAAEIGARIIKNQRRVNGVLAANHDALVRDKPVGMEAKTTGILNPQMARDEWGDAGTDQVPDRVLIQCHHQMIVSDLSTVYVPALIGGRGRVLFEVTRSAELAEAMLAKLTDWWQRHVEADTKPEGTLPSLDTLKRVRRQPQSQAYLKDELLSRWLEAKLIRSAAETQEENAKQAMLDALGDAEMGVTGIGAVTYLKQERMDLDRLKLREDFPDAFGACQRRSEFRVLRFKKSK